MFDDRYKYTQIPSPLVQPGGMRGLLDFGSTTVIGEESDVRCNTPQAHVPANGGTAPKAHNVRSHQKPLVTGGASFSKKKKTNPAKIVIAVVIIIFVVNLLFGAIAGVMSSARSVFRTFEQNIDRTLDSFLGFEEHELADDEVLNYAAAMGWGDAYRAFKGEDGNEYYYLPADDIFLGDEDGLVAYYHFSNGYEQVNGQKISKPKAVRDSVYADLVDEGIEQ